MGQPATITLNYTPHNSWMRFHQRQSRFFIAVAHKRSGKTTAVIWDLITRAIYGKNKQELYGYIGPLRSNAQTIAWLILKQATANLPGIIVSESSLSITFPHNQATVRIFGSDYPDTLIGLPFDGVVFDEYENHRNTHIWTEIVRPQLIDRRGFAVFTGTPKGFNHFYHLVKHAENNREWETVWLKASDTNILSQAYLEEAQRTLTKEQYQQEIECSFEAQIKGIQLPAYGWKPRDYQQPFWKYMEDGGKRACVVWHRRSGKDECALQFLAKYALFNPGTYFYLFPEANHLRQAIWNSVNPHTGRRRIYEIFPEEIRVKTRDNEMMIELISPTGEGSGSVIQFGGSDNYDRLVGASARGVIFSEYALADPRGWDLISPMLVETGGFAIFISTPRGKNHFYDLYEAAKDDENWFCQVLPATETTVFTQEQLKGERDNLVNSRGDDIGMAIYNQEYGCSFTAAVIGACYAPTLEAWEKTNQTTVAWNPSYPVYTAWDLGYGDATAIWFAQVVNKEIHLIDYYEASGQGIDHYVKLLKERPFIYETAILPHDAAHGNVRTEGGKSFEQLLNGFGFKTFTIGRRLDISSVLQQVRLELPRCYFDVQQTKHGLDALKAYSFRWDPIRKILSEQPIHNWASHGSDSFSHLIIGLSQLIKPTVIQQKKHRNRNSHYEYGTSVWSM